MSITINLKPGYYFARGNDFIKLVQQYGEHCFIVHYYSIDMKYNGAGYMTDKEIEKYININGFHTDFDFE